MYWQHYVSPSWTLYRQHRGQMYPGRRMFSALRRSHLSFQALCLRFELVSCFEVLAMMASSGGGYSYTSDRSYCILKRIPNRVPSPDSICRSLCGVRARVFQRLRVIDLETPDKKLRVIRIDNIFTDTEPSAPPIADLPDKLTQRVTKPCSGRRIQKLYCHGRMRAFSVPQHHGVERRKHNRGAITIFFGGEVKLFIVNSFEHQAPKPETSAFSWRCNTPTLPQGQVQSAAEQR